MDPDVLAILVGAVGIAGTVAGVAVADVLAGRRDKATRRRERRLLALQQTKQLIHAHLTDALEVAAGGASSRLYGSDVYPLADPRLVGDVDSLNKYLGVAIDLLRRDKAAGARESDGRAVADAFVNVDAAIARQEALALARIHRSPARRPGVRTEMGIASPGGARTALTTAARAGEPMDRGVRGQPDMVAATLPPAPEPRAVGQCLVR